MKKFGKGLTLFFVLCAFGYFGFTTYKKSRAFLGLVHENADSVIKVGIQDIRETLAWDALTSPRYYYENSVDKEKEEEDDAKESKNNGVTISYNLFVYTLPEIDNSYFSTFEIHNVSELESFLEEELDKKSLEIQDAEDKSYRFAILKDIKLVLAWTSEKLVVAASLTPSFSNVKQVFKDVLVANKTIQEGDHELFKVLKRESSHLTYTNGKSVLNFNFKDGEVYLEGMILALTSEKFPEEVAVETNLDASLSLYFDANFEQKFLKQAFIQNFSTTTFFSKNNLDVSQIANRTNGFFSFEIQGKTTQQDTIITYEYDENFEKVEKKTIQSKVVPKILLKVGAENESLQQYLSEAAVLNANNIFTPFPLYQFQVEEDAVYTYFSTFRDSIKSKEKISSNFFDTKVNFERLQQDLDIPQTAKLFSLLENLRIRAWQANIGEINMYGRLKGKNAKINILSQIFFGMQEAEKPQNEEAEL